MERALESLPFATVKDYSKKDLFDKVEALLVAHKPNWAPRVIFKGTDVYNAVSGPIMNELMSRLDNCFVHMEGEYKFMTSYKKTPEQYVPFIESDDQDSSFLECDFSSNDKFQCQDVQTFEMAFMRVLGCPEWFVRLHAKTNQFMVRSYEHQVSAKLNFQLPTGATDTTFRNTFWNGCILWSYLKRVKAKSCRALLLGDDMLAMVKGIPRYAAKTYTNVAAEANMEAKCFRRDVLSKCTFLSRFFIPTRVGGHFTVPILGKALGRFNMRANNNESVSDHAYMAGKSVGYAYEFRFFPSVRDLFLQRFKYEYENALLKGLKDELVEVSWNARTAGVTLKNIKSKIVIDEVLSDCEFSDFCYYRYGVLGDDVIKLFEDVVLCTDAIELEGAVVELLQADFIEEK